MHLLSEYTSFEIVLFFRLADKHNHNIDLVSAILRSHPLVTQEEGYNADRLSTPALVSLLRQLLEDDQRAQSEIKGAYRANSANNASATRLTGAGADDDKTIRDAVERIWLKSWKRLSEDLIKSIQECEEKDKRLLNQIKTLDRDGHLPKPIAGAPPRNGVAASGPAQHPQDIKPPARHVVSPVTGPVPEASKKTLTPAPQPASAIPPNREAGTPIRAPQPQPAQMSQAPQASSQPQPQPFQTPLHASQLLAQAAPQHPQNPQQPRPPQPQQTQPHPPQLPHTPHLLRPLQPSPVTARPNGATQVLQAPPGISQSLSHFAQPGRPASPATLSPKPPLDSTAKPGPPASLAHPQTSVQPPLKWEAPYQGPQQHIPPHRPLQPNTARNAASQPPQPPQSIQHPQVFKRPAASVPPTQPPVQQTSQPPIPTTQQPPSVPHGVLAPPQTGPQLGGRPPQPVPKSSMDAARSHPVTPVPPPRIPHGLFKAPVTPVAKARQPAPSQPAVQKAANPVTPAQPITPAVARPIYHPKQPLTVTPIPHPELPVSQPPALQAKPEVAKRDAPPQTQTTPLPTAARPQTPLAEQSSLLRNSAFATLQRKLNDRLSASAPQSPKTPQATTPTTLQTGHSTKWVISSTPSTPRPHDLIVDNVQGPSYEPITSPIQKPARPLSATPRTAKQKPSPKTVQKVDTSATKIRGRPRRSAQIARSATASSGPTRRSQSVASHVDELSMDHHDFASRLKEEASTSQRASEETGDTTADESVASRRTVGLGSVSRASTKRKRQDSEATPHAFPLPPLPPAPPLTGPPTHVHWTRGFQKVSASALDQIGSHRDANMFANQIRERDAPNYGGIVLQPQNIASIKKAITHGGRVALQTAQSLPGGDPGTPVVLLPLSEDLVPPKGIINSAQLERELVHMFCNAVMYNPDPHRGPGPAFLRNRHGRGGDDSLGYKMDEFGVVRSTRNMFVEVEKLLTDLRNAESQKGLPSASTVSLPPAEPGSATPGPAASGTAAADDTADDMDELARDDASNASRRKRIKT